MRQGKPAASDEELVRRTAIRLGWQFAAVAAAIVLLVLGGTLLIELLVHQFHPRPQVRPKGVVDPDGDDGILRVSLYAAAALSVIAAGVAGFLLGRRAVRPLGQALALQRRFVADAGHELRTPLTVLHTRAQLAERRMRPDDPARPTVEQLLADSRVLADIVDELLESAQFSQSPDRAEIIAVKTLLEDVAASMRVLADGAGVALTTTSPDGLHISGSRSALTRALTSLVDNALGHTPPGGTVTLAAGTDGGQVVIEISDDGEGLGTADPSRLTERFARGTVRQHGPAGRRFGLGLALVREVAVAHRGSLSLSDRQGGGAIATLRLPAGDPQPTDQPVGPT